MVKFGCPKGHTEGIEESYGQIHIWFPVSAETGETDMEASLDRPDCIDWGGMESDGRYWCPACGDTFDKLVEHEVELMADSTGDPTDYSHGKPIGCSIEGCTGVFATAAEADEHERTHHRDG